MLDNERADDRQATDRDESHDEAGTDLPAGLDDAGGSTGDADDPAGDGGGDLDSVRDLILKAYPDIVPELLAGESVEAMLSSVPAARDAYKRITTTIQEQTPAPIPTGSGRRPPVDPEGLSPESLIRVGIREQGLGISR